MKTQLAALFFCFYGILCCRGQDTEQIFKLINERKLDSAFSLSQQALATQPDNPDVQYTAGKANMLKGNIAAAIKNLEQVLKMPSLKTSIRDLAMYDLGICYFASGNSNKAKDLISASGQLNPTKNTVENAEKLNSILGFDSAYHSWSTRETTNFIFHFQTEMADMERIMARKEQAFNTINAFFKAKLPKKIDYFIWTNEGDAQKLLNVPLAFTEPALALTHTSAKHTAGHEMTHAISYFAGAIKRRHKLIWEGVCVCFDLSGRSNIETLKKMGFKSSIEQIWNNKIPADMDVVYPLGGELVKRLIEKNGRDKFLQLLTDQSYQNALKIYGSNLKSVIAEIENELKE